ncbi:MAG TPA: hypothetical protein VLE45_16870 [Burkholderiaceae bacterium]|nr:hypothetical protein [Burkholderiaceae bacterium]
MGAKIVKTVMGLIGVLLAVGFFAPPVLKLKDPAMFIVILIGVVAMVYNLIETVRERDDT